MKKAEEKPKNITFSKPLKFNNTGARTLDLSYDIKNCYKRHFWRGKDFVIYKRNIVLDSHDIMLQNILFTSALFNFNTWLYT